MKTILKLFPIFSLAFILSCTIDPYDAGDGKYSYYTAGMVSFKPDKDTLIYIGQLDDNRTLKMTQKLKVKGWKPDSLCRMMLYFNKMSETAEEITATPLGAEVCHIPAIQLADTLKIMPKTDPLNIISAWKSANGEYYNIHFAIKTGAADKNIQQSVGLVCDSISNNRVFIHLIHNQNNAPEFYSVEGFLSIKNKKLKELAGTENPSLNLKVNTYNGFESFDYSQKKSN